MAKAGRQTAQALNASFPWTNLGQFADGEPPLSPLSGFVTPSAGFLRLCMVYAMLSMRSVAAGGRDKGVATGG